MPSGAQAATLSAIRKPASSAAFASGATCCTSPIRYASSALQWFPRVSLILLDFQIPNFTETDSAFDVPAHLQIEKHAFPPLRLGRVSCVRRDAAEIADALSLRCFDFLVQRPILPDLHARSGKKCHFFHAERSVMLVLPKQHQPLLDRVIEALSQKNITQTSQPSCTLITTSVASSRCGCPSANADTSSRMPLMIRSGDSRLQERNNLSSLCSPH